MSCSNCYNGCPQIVSDQCVKYTGVDVPVLGIQTGDSLSYVEQALITFLTSTLDGTGIKIDIDPDIICDKVQEYLVQCEDITAKNLFETLIKVVCDLQVQIDGLDSAIVAIENTLSILNADYNVDCLSGVTNSSDTHAVLQAVITKLCQLITSLPLTYVEIADIDTYIQAYLNSLGSSLYSAKMIPYIAYEYYGPIGPTPTDPSSGFDVTGAGYGNWYRVFLCNGDNGTPDKRGRVAIGVTTGMGGTIPMDPAVNPSNPLNPDYLIGDTTIGSNVITLTSTQIPSHTHANTLNFNDPEHFHYQYNNNSGGETAPTVSATTYPNVRHDNESGLSYRTTGDATVSTLGKTSSNSTGITCTITNASAGGDEPHNNYQPAIGAYYIMYIPL